MAVSERPARSWDIDDLQDIGRRGNITYRKAIPVLILEKWVREGRQEAAKVVRTQEIARRLTESKLKTGLKGKRSAVLLGGLVMMQNARNLTDPSLIEYVPKWKSFKINLPHYERLLQEYRQWYRDKYQEDYAKLFPRGEPEWESPTPPEVRAEPEEPGRVSPGSEEGDEIQSLLAPIEQALCDRQQAIDRLTEENQKLQAELAALQGQERKSEDTELTFVHTSPDFYHSVYGRKVTSIKDTIEAMLDRAEHSIRVSTLQIDIFADSLIKHKRRNLEITVLTRAKPQGDRKGIASRAIHRMQKCGIQVYVDQELLHSRLLIIDDQEVLVSSADLDVTQLEFEFNAGVWTGDPGVVAEAIRYFDNILNARK